MHKQKLLKAQNRAAILNVICLVIDLLPEADNFLGPAVVMRINVFNSELLIFSGEGVRYGEPLRAPMREALHHNTLPALLDGLQLHVEPLDDDVWARGQPRPAGAFPHVTTRLRFRRQFVSFFARTLFNP